MNDSHALDGHEVPGPGHYDTTKMKPNARSAPSITIGVRYAVKEQVSENPGPYVNISIVLQNNHSSKRIVLLYTLIQIYQYTQTHEKINPTHSSNSRTAAQATLRRCRWEENRRITLDETCV